MSEHINMSLVQGPGVGRPTPCEGDAEQFAQIVKAIHSARERFIKLTSGYVSNCHYDEEPVEPKDQNEEGYE